MRVLLTHEAFAPDFAGGGEYILLEMARGLLRRGIELTVLTAGDPAVEHFEEIRTVRLPVGKFRLNLAAPRIAALARDADLIQTSTFHAAAPSLLAGRITGKPVVCHVLGLFQEAWKEMHPGIGAAARIAWERMIVRRRFAKLVFLSDYSLETGVRLGARRESAVAIPPGIRVERYRADLPKEPVVLFAGKLDVRKGIHQVLAAARELPEVRFRVMGWGKDEESVRRDAPSNVEFLGFLTGQALEEAYGRAQVCLLPSKAETFGLTVIEAMASGCAIVSSIPLPFEGFHTDAEDVSGMVNALRSLLGNPERTREIGRLNAAKAQFYTWDRHVDRLTAIYEEVLGGCAKASRRASAAQGGGLA